ncbi:MAG TPA: NUDIX domain-containing protein [archaeon]|nr:NUDIX domain-containing protein [archaeon]
MKEYVRTIRELVGSRRILLPGVRAIIVNENGEVLLQRRTDMALWGLPSGSVELDETALEALRREVAEETALKVTQAEPMALYSGPGQRLVYPGGDEIQAFSVAFIVRKWEGEPRPDGVECSERRFFPLSHLPDDLLPMHKQTLDDYLRYDGKFLLP